MQLPDHVMQPREFADVILATNWIPDRETQLFCVDFLASLKSFRLSCSATAGRKATLPEEEAKKEGSSRTCTDSLALKYDCSVGVV